MNNYEITKDNYLLLTDKTGHKCSFTLSVFKFNPEWFKHTYNLSQEEIDDLVREMTLNKTRDEQLEFNLAPGFNWQEDKPKAEAKCPPHNFVEYLGLNERFMHCKDCGEKKL